MKILVLTNLYPPHYLGGYELICQTVLEALQARGHEIRILTSDHVVDSVVDSVERIPIDRSLRINGLYGHPWQGIQGLRRLEMHNNNTLRAAIQRHHPDLVYVWNMSGLSKSLLFTLQDSGLPVVFYISDHWMIRGLASDVWLGWWNQSKLRITQRLVRAWWNWTGARRRWNQSAPTNSIRGLKFGRIYFCSHALKELTMTAGFNVAHGEIIYCPVHLRYFPPCLTEPRKRVTRLLYAGRLTEDKGVMTALWALAILRGKQAFQLDIYGRGDNAYEERLRRFAQENQLTVNFATAGLDEMPQIYANHDILLFTSEWAEPFALTPIEAMASGLPVIGTTTGGSAELFRDGENGLTYGAGNARELADRIWQFSTDYGLRSRCVLFAHGEARQRYAAPIICDQIEEYLNHSFRN